jgi:hypothetical protein
VARDSSEAALMISTGAQPNGAGAREAAPPPQLYSAPDPEEDPEAQVNILRAGFSTGCHEFSSYLPDNGIRVHRGEWRTWPCWQCRHRT